MKALKNIVHFACKALIYYNVIMQITKSACKEQQYRRE